MVAFSKSFVVSFAVLARLRVLNRPSRRGSSCTSGHPFFQVFVPALSRAVEALQIRSVPRLDNGAEHAVVDVDTRDVEALEIVRRGEFRPFGLAAGAVVVARCVIRSSRGDGRNGDLDGRTGLDRDAGLVGRDSG